jgi:hypothetical protein
MGHREFTRESALAKVLRKDGIKLIYVNELPVIEMTEECDAGNGTWGALDYLAREHKIPTLRVHGKAVILCT